MCAYICIYIYIYIWFAGPGRSWRRGQRPEAAAPHALCLCGLFILRVFHMVSISGKSAADADRRDVRRTLYATLFIFEFYVAVSIFTRKLARVPNWCQLSMLARNVQKSREARPLPPCRRAFPTT